MKLVQLTLTGFKSFRNPTSIHFDKGITGIVGPNGCGKSNIVDAILWVSGSGIASQLRGKQMEDVIFAGTDTSVASSFAEVSLSFEKSDSKSWPEGYEKLDEIVVTRKIKRGSDSQYFINSEPCLLRDIQEIMMSVGAMGFSVVEQGNISQMISYKPDQLKGLVDQVAEMSQFKNKKRLAQNKLKVTQQNLLRVTDVLLEQKKQLGRLEKQSKQAQEYKILKEKLHRIEALSLRKSYFKIQQSLEEKLQRLNEWMETQEVSKITLDSLEEDSQKFRTESQALYADLERKRKDVSRAFEKATHYEMEIQKLKISIDSKKGYNSQLTSDISYFKNFQIQKEKEISDLNAQIQKDQIQLGRWAQELESQKDRLKKFQLQQDWIEREKAQADLNFEKVLKEEIQLQEELKSSEKEQKRLKELIQLQKEDLEKKEKQCQQAQKSCQFLLSKVSDLEREHLNLKEEIRSQKENISNIKSLKEEKEKEFEKLRVSLVQEESKKKTFVSLKEKMGSPVSGYEWLKKEKSYPVLYEMLEIDKGYEKAVQATLNQYLYSFVAKNLSEIESILKQVHQKSLSRVNMVFSSKQDSFSLFKAPKPKEFECFLRKKVKCKKGFEKYNPLLDLLLKDVAVVRSFKQLPSKFICVTVRGDVALGCRVSGGSANLETLDFFKEIDVLENRIQSLTQQKEVLKKKKEDFSTLLQKLNIKKETLVQKQLHQDQILKEIKKDLEYSKKQETFFKEEVQSLYMSLKIQEDALQRCQKDSSQKREQCQNYSSKMASVQESSAQTVQKLNKNREQKEKLNLSVSRSSIQVFSLNKDLKNKKNQIQVLKHSMKEISQKEKEFLTKLNQNKDQVYQNSSQIKTLEEKLKQSKKGYQLQIETQERLEESYQKKLQSYQELEKKILESQNKVQSFSDQKHEVETDIQVLQSERKNLEERAFENFEIDLKNLSKEELQPKAFEEESKEEEVERLKNQISRIGQVNLLALQEYEELFEENKKLLTQSGDLNQSKCDLEKIIDEMESLSNKKFKQAFEEVNSHFQKVFSAVFGGGQACLTLDTQGGMEIFVSPPGKKLKNLRLLSGGEKSLTALCMILALFLVRPAPFCVFDEVDAALDDQNVLRFNSLMFEIAKKCQVILVTHNKYSMKECDRLYGVTMEEKGITQLLSVEMISETPSHPS